MTSYGLCALCGNTVPMDLLPEHLAEHDLKITAEQVRNAPIVDLTGESPIRTIKRGTTIIHTDRECRVCGCTETDACVDEEGTVCGWSEPDLCSFCASQR